MLPAALIVAALLVGCGGGHRSKRSTTGAQGKPSPSHSASSPASIATSSTQPALDTYWPYDKLVASLAGRTLTLPNGPVRVDPALLECDGDRAPLQTGSPRRWSHYTCTQTLFRGGVDRDMTFDVTILNATQLSISAERYGPE